MSQSRCIEILATMLLLIKGTRPCDETICLKWIITKSELILTCKIEFLYLGVYIDDPFGKTQGECFPPIPYDCEAYYRNGSIRQHQRTKETIFTLRGNIDNQISGNWSCRHGTSKEKAVAYVTMFNAVEKKNNDDNGNGNVSNKSTTFSGKDVFLRESDPLSFTTTMSNITNSGKREDLIYYIVVSVAVVLLVISIKICKVWINSRYRILIIKTSKGDTQNSSRETEESQRHEDITTYYETINENEMINDIISLRDENIFQHSNRQINTTSQYFISMSSLSTYSSEYEEVVNVHPNMYHSLENTPDNEDLHNYCTTAAYSGVLKNDLSQWNESELAETYEPKVNLRTLTSLRRECKSDDISTSYLFKRVNSLPNTANAFYTV